MRFSLVVGVLLLCVSTARAISIATVPITSPGNVADMRYAGSNFPNGRGSVDHFFYMGEFEVSNTQYVAFLNAVAKTDQFGLYNPNMTTSTAGGIVRGGTPGNYSYSVKPSVSNVTPYNTTYSYGDKPILLVDWGDVVRFANWLHNGQPAGAQDASTTEDGAYTLNGAVNTLSLNAVVRNPGARWWVPNDDEWYKAAYYNSNLQTYFDFPTGTNTTPVSRLPSQDTGNSANYSVAGERTTGNDDYPLTSIGAYQNSSSPFGTFDQGGNVEEWTDTLYAGSGRITLGGSFSDADRFMRANLVSVLTPTSSGARGFRVATSIPEPSAMLITISGAAFLLARRQKPILRNRS